MLSLARIKQALLAPVACATLLLVGCAANNGAAEDVDVTEAAVVTGAPITMENWQSHPKIREISDLVDELNTMHGHGALGTVEKTACGSRLKMFTAHEGVVRKMFQVTGTGLRTELFYGDSGQLRFVHFKDASGAAELEGLVYFDETGTDILWQVVRIDVSAYREPDADEQFIVDERHQNPARWFELAESTCEGG